MKKILVTGSTGQIGSELIVRLRELYGRDNVVGSARKGKDEDFAAGPFETMDVQDAGRLAELVDKYQIDTIINNAAMLSAVGEQNPQALWAVNMGGLYNVLEVAREKNLKVFIPSSIAAFGPGTPLEQTPQDTIQRPSTIYGVSKVAGELLCDYYFKRFGVDTRGVRYPGIISYKTLPGGGTTDYAVHIYFDAIKQGRYTSFIDKGTFMDMMYMPDAVECVIDLMETDPSKLKHRNAFNVSAMSIDPEMLAAEIRQHIPEFVLDYEVDPVRQAIAESWPNSLDTSAAKEEWGFEPKFDLAAMTVDMIKGIKHESDL
ncbi:MAG TPA: NAD-dependent epimerase/dehydratase family protein [Tissierellia bacterium]|nr:NAD-dependent epimerase/dehydratase family protein [Tissierellia bacterium]